MGTNKKKDIHLKDFSSLSFSGKLSFFASTSCGFGLLPGAPGTWGTIPGVIIHVMVVLIFPPHYQRTVLISTFLVICITSYFLGNWSQRYWESKDPAHFTLDEVAGYLLVPILFHHGLFWQTVLWGFLFFRLFDIIKLPPARQIDSSMNSAWGILLDDLVSSFYAAATLYILMKSGAAFGLEQWLIKV